MSFLKGSLKNGNSIACLYNLGKHLIIGAAKLSLKR